MTAKEYCTTHKAIAYYSGLAGVEIYGGVEDYIFCVSGAWCSRKSYHRVKIGYTVSGKAFIRINGVRIPLDECLRI